MKSDKIVLEKRIYEILQEETEDQDNNETSEQNDNNEENVENKEDEKEDVEVEEFSAESFEDFLNKTETKVKISKVSCEPSPIFGPNDTNNHNKYKVTISNDKGSVWFYFWDSIKNTTENKTPKMENVMSSFGLDVASVKDGVSLEEFEKMFGYDKTDNDLSQKAYDGCRKMAERAKKLFEENQIDELIRLSNEY